VQIIILQMFEALSKIMDFIIFQKLSLLINYILFQSIVNII